MTAIIRRELSSYFSSPIGYIFLAVFYVFSGFYFMVTTLGPRTTDLAGVFGSLFTIVLFLIPLLTMRLFSEDLKHRTDQALLTAPINLTSLVLGKFFAAVFVFALGLSITLVYGVIIATFAPPNWASIWGNYAALLLLGMALISVGMFISSMTENQVIAAVGVFAVSLLLLFIDALSGIVSSPFVLMLLRSLSFMLRFDGFTSGLFDLSSAMFFFSVSLVFVFLTVRVLERRRWS